MRAVEHILSRKLSAADSWFVIVLALVFIWLIASAILIQGEYGDGYQTIVNGRYFFGDSPGIFAQRGPLAALALLPVEAFVDWTNWNPLDVRPYHLYSALLHSIYIAGCWLLLRRSDHDSVAQFVALLGAVLSVVFYAFAPFLNHDIIPGLLFLLMIFVCHRWLDSPNSKQAVILVVVGAMVVLIKQTYAIFWVAICVYAVIALACRWDNARVDVRKILLLIALAGASALISWCGYAAFLGPELPDMSWWLRPVTLIEAISGQYGSEFSERFSPYIYVRNLHNYGILAAALAIPGVVLAFRNGHGRTRLAAVCWIVGLLAMSLIAFKEVRYLLFLAPLTALLIVPVVQMLLRHRQLAVIAFGILAVDQVRGLSVAAAQLGSAAVTDVRRFMDAPSGDGRQFASRALSFVYMAESPLTRDPYHGIYHLTATQLYRLQEARRDVQVVRDPRDLGSLGIKPGDRVYFANNTMIRRSPWPPANQPVDLKQFVSVAGDAATVTLRRQDQNFAVAGHDGSYILFVPGANVGPQLPFITTGELSPSQAQLLYGELAESNDLDVIGVSVAAFCQADQCSYR